MGDVRIYIDRNDWWIGVYRGTNHWYFCPLPCVVIRWNRSVVPEEARDGE